MSNSVIKIKKGSVEIKFPKDELMKVEPTHDGVVFQLKGGLQVYYAEPYMQNQAKQIISHSVNKVEGIVTVDLLNPNSPVSVELLPN